jgi:molybdopterin converting factor small subunit
MQILVKFYTSFKAVTGVDHTYLDIPEGTTVSQAMKLLAKKYENAPFSQDGLIVVVNEKIAPRDQVLKDGDTAMLYHQFAGG